MKREFLFFLIIAQVFLYQSLGGVIFSAEQEGEADKILIPVRASVPPKIDGNLDDEVWQSPPLAKEFISYFPLYGEVLPQKTEVWLAYDSKNLYFAFKCFDTEPEKIKTSITKRDNMFSDDWVGLSLDSLGNKQSSYEYYVNPNGIQGDNMRSAAGSTDDSVDFVWYSAGKLTDDGYQVEISIPLRSIRFKSSKEVNMGILFMRKISRLGIGSSWPDIKPGYGLFNIQASLVYRDLKSPLNLELLPSFTYGRNEVRENPDSWGEPETFNDIGMGIKYGITSSVTADLTLNPDFSQVESDAFQAEVNRRYPIFYAEKRPFFMEGVDILDFALIPHGNMYTAVHTRRIVDPNWGAKLTGTLGKTSFGILAAGDQWPGLAWDDEVNPFEGETAYFTIARGKYRLGGQNYIGGLYSGREFVGSYNRVVGGDVMYRFLKNHHASLSLMQSYSGELEGGPETSGSALNCFYRYFTKPLGILVAYERYGTDFRMDSAFYERIGISSGKIWIGPSFYPNPKKVSWLKRVNPNLLVVYLHDFTTNIDDRFLSLSTEFNFTKQGYLEIGYILESESWVNQTFDQSNFE